MMKVLRATGKVLRATGRWLSKVMTEGGPPSIGSGGERLREQAMVEEIRNQSGST
jgi:hypothetical protein